MKLLRLFLASLGSAFAIWCELVLGATYVALVPDSSDPGWDSPAKGATEVLAQSALTLPWVLFLGGGLSLALGVVLKASGHLRPKSIVLALISVSMLGGVGVSVIAEGKNAVEHCLIAVAGAGLWVAVMAAPAWIYWRIARHAI